jgi:hypothetical protein
MPDRTLIEILPHPLDSNQIPTVFLAHIRYTLCQTHGFAKDETNALSASLTIFVKMHYHFRQQNPHAHDWQKVKKSCSRIIEWSHARQNRALTV